LKEKNRASCHRQALSRTIRTQKSQLADRIVKDVVATLESDEASVSVAIEEVQPGEWAEKVYTPDIASHPDRLYKKPGYNPLR
jgi:4-oxalocrotonate tautomerase